MLEVLVLCAFAVAIGAAFGRNVLPRGPANALQRTIERRVENRKARRRVEDPFATLKVQMQLSRLSSEILALERGERGAYARGFHLQAAILAYERALEEGCRLAGAGAVDGSGAVNRLIAESELRSRGWTW